MIIMAGGIARERARTMTTRFADHYHVTISRTRIKSSSRVFFFFKVSRLKYLAHSIISKLCWVVQKMANANP